MNEYQIFAAKHYVTPFEKLSAAIPNIEKEMHEQVKKYEDRGKLVEAQRLAQRVNYDIEMLREIGYCSGIENYSRFIENRAPGSPPSTLLDYFPDDYLLVVDESHMTIPQVRGMYNGDRARKMNLVEHGFRLPSALDNRPLRFDEFERRVNQSIYTTATPGEYEMTMSVRSAKKIKNFSAHKGVVEQVIRPTGLLDPTVDIRPTQFQIDDLIKEINVEVKEGRRVIVTTLTKRMSEDLTEHLVELGMKVQYLHSEIDTIERVEILKDLRLGKYDVLVGINLLREGIDLPEVSLVAILDADKEGFLRSYSALVQIMGRAARHEKGRVVMYADRMTDSIKKAVGETERRRQIQIEYNSKHGITPTSIKKEIKDQLERTKPKDDPTYGMEAQNLEKDKIEVLIEELENKMDLAARELRFEDAAELRDKITELERELTR